MIYYAEVEGRGCCLLTNRRDFIKAQGTANIRLIRKAEKKDIDWVRAMGGYVPERRPLSQKERQ